MSLSPNSTASDSSERANDTYSVALACSGSKSSTRGSLEASRCLVRSLRGLEAQVALMFLEQFLEAGLVLQASLVR